jgi:two-component system sensor histidine kinase/response regulator
VVPAAIRERFFDKFATAGKAEGTGLGTYSARLLAQAQQGDVHMHTSDESDTTVITVSLPA